VVGADEAGDVGQEMNVRARGQMLPQFPRLEVVWVGQSRHVGCQAQLLHRKPQHQVVHARVAHQHFLDDLRAVAPGLRAQLAGQAVQPADECTLEFLCLILPIHRIGDAGHHVFPIGDLGVHRASGHQCLAVLQIYQVGGHFGRADVHRQPQR